MAAEVAGQTGADALIADQIAYYRARAGEYDQSMLELGRYISMGGSVAGRPGDEDGQEVATLLEALEGSGRFETVLELACGTGWWTQWLPPPSQPAAPGGAPTEMLG